MKRERGREGERRRERGREGEGKRGRGGMRRDRGRDEEGECNEKGMWISLIKRIVRVCILIVTVITCTCLS